MLCVFGSWKVLDDVCIMIRCSSAYEGFYTERRHWFRSMDVKVKGRIQHRKRVHQVFVFEVVTL
jgi:hypothetical protein